MDLLNLKQRLSSGVGTPFEVRNLIVHTSTSHSGISLAVKHGNPASVVSLAFVFSRGLGRLSNV